MAYESLGFNEDELTPRYRAFIKDAIKQAIGGDPNNADPVIHGFDVGFSDLIIYDQSVGSLAREGLDRYPEVSPSHMRRRFSAVIRAVDMNEDVSAMLERKSPTAWAARISELAESEQHRSNILDLAQHNVMSNVSERGKLLNAVIQLHGWGDRPLKIVDLGCSLNNNLKRLTMQNNTLQRYKTTRVLQPLEEGEFALKRDARLTSRFDRLMRRAAPLLLDGVGVDVSDFNNIDVRRLAMTQRYPKEIANTIASRQFELVTAANVRNVRMIQADARTMDPEKIGHPAHVAYMCTMLYQLSPEDVKAVIKTAHDSTRDDGLLVIQDFVKEYDPATQEFTFYEDKWPKYSYSVWVYDKAQPEYGWRKHYTVDSGRVHAVIIEDPAYEEPAARDWGLTKQRVAD